MNDPVRFEDFVASMRMAGIELAADISADMTFEEAGVDSLAVMSIIAAVEQQGIEFPAHLHLLVETFGDLFHAYASSKERQS